jgi:hypothetical protein
VVAFVSALMSVLASSKVTITVLSLKDTIALATPGTPSRLFFTMKGQSAQYIFSTANVTVFSPANATDELANPKTSAAVPDNLGHQHFSLHELSISGASKSTPRAAATRIVATIRPALTSLFGNGRAHAASSAQASCLERWTSQYPQARNETVAAMNHGWYGASCVKFPIQAPLTPKPKRSKGKMQQDEAANAPSKPPVAINTGPN